MCDDILQRPTKYNYTITHNTFIQGISNTFIFINRTNHIYRDCSSMKAVLNTPVGKSALLGMFWSSQLAAGPN